MTFAADFRRSAVNLLAALTLSTLCIASAVSPALAASYGTVTQRG